MEYNYSGVIHRLQMWGSICAIAIIILLISRFWIREKRKKKEVLFGIFSLIAGAAYVVFYLSILINPSIESFTGTFEKSYRKGRLSPSTYEYIFSDKTERMFLYLDLASVKELYPEGLAEGYRYKVYYETRRSIIVGIEPKGR